jgi:D-lactate dehydrogenase
VEPGLIGGEVNRLLARYKHMNKLQDQYKIGPDPASIESCMIGGIVSNNSSGMCCGVAKNSYHTMKDLRLVFVDGTVLDTSDPASVESFKVSHADLLRQVSELAAEVQSDQTLVALIKKKFAIKCTTGYSINALVDAPPSDPMAILKKLIIGSEGTLAFVSKVTFNTVPEYPDKASCFVLFPDVEMACEAAYKLRQQDKASAVELFDRASLREFENDDKMLKLVDGLQESGEYAASLLIECTGPDEADLNARIKAVVDLLGKEKCIGPREDVPKTIEDYPFTKEAAEYNCFWNARKGLIPVVGAARPTGTSMLIEDVACSVDQLGKMTKDLIYMFKKYGYDDAATFGHALEGNLHLVFSQGFRSTAEIERFDAMMQEMAYIVATKYGGSLKAEHGTGRNVAPFVEMEWGTKAYDIMWKLKAIFDPDNILNPGVILNKDPEIHMKSLKQSPVADSTYDVANKCIECGFCESNCPSRDLSLTPRQRVTVYREISRLKAKTARSPEEEARLVEMTEAFDYMGNATCAADGMCQEKCPVKINTGELIKNLREREMSESANSLAMFAANNFGMVNAMVPPLLNTVNLAHSVLGPGVLEKTSRLLNKVSGNLIPKWNRYMPTGAKKLDTSECASSVEEVDVRNSVVYIPSCVTRMMGPAKGDNVDGSVHEKMISILKKANYNVIIPEGINSMCCGMMFDSRGNKPAANKKAFDLEDVLKDVSLNGRTPIICDTSPCTQTIKNKLRDKMLGFSIYEPVEFINHFLLHRLEFNKVKEDVTIHVPCSSKKMGIESNFKKLAGMCAENVHESGIPCCGMAGDRGMRYEELTKSSLQHLEVPTGCNDGYSTSRTCEMSLSRQSDVNFRGLLYLIDEATEGKQKTASN